MALVAVVGQKRANLFFKEFDLLGPQLTCERHRSTRECDEYREELPGQWTFHGANLTSSRDF